MTEKISNIMLIDDEDIDRRMYQRVLNRSGIVENIISFGYADEALDFLKNGEAPDIDVIFLDINMPRMNGFEFLDAATRDLGQKFAKIVIIMLTTSLDPLDQRRAFEYEIVKEFLNKPLTIEDVQRAAKLLAQHGK